MTVLPLYCMIWHDLPTSLPPPKQRNISSSAGSTGSSATVPMAEAFRLDAMIGVVEEVMEDPNGSSKAGSLSWRLLVNHQGRSFDCRIGKLGGIPTHRLSTFIHPINLAHQG